MKKEMLINVLQPEECRIAIVENGLLEELYVERTSHESYVGNIYKGRVVNIEPSIQAAFIDFGVGRNGFLHVSDVEPTYYRHLQPEGDSQDRDRSQQRGRGRRRSAEGQGRRRAEAEDVDAGSSAMTLTSEWETYVESTPALPEVEPPEDTEPLDEIADDQDVVAPEATVAEEDVGEDTSEIDDDAITFTSAPTARPPAREAVVTEEAAAEVEDEPETPAATEIPTAAQDVASTAATSETAPVSESSEETTDSEEVLEPAPETEKTRWMNSAEHRKDEETVKPEPADGGDPSSSDGISDDDILFSPPAQTAPAEVAVEPPEPDPEPTEAIDAETDEMEFAADHGVDNGDEHGLTEPEDEWFEPSIDRSVPIERELERDLRDAEVGAARPVTSTFDAADVVDEPEFRERDDYRPQRSDRGPRRGGDRRGDGRGDRGSDRRGGRRGDRDGDRRGDRGGDRRGDRGHARRGRNDQRPFGRPKPLIQDVFRRGQEVLVQVIKEGLGPKGPTLSTYISIAGRYLVLMPGLNRVGVSRKIIDEDQRRRLRDIFVDLKPPRGLGFIIRTAGEDRTKRELQRDLSYLSRLWQVVVRRIRKAKSPVEIYQESDMITRTIRDTFSGDIDTIWIDEPKAFEHAQEFMQIVMPRYADRIKLYDGKEPMFHKYGIENEIQRIQQRKVPLPNGGSVVIEQTEALVAIDVNSGNYRAESNNAEETAYQMNMAAAKEIARQLRLRDLGGVIVNDFIDMRDEKHRRGVERALREAVKRDRARTKVLRMSQFGIVEMTRQRIRPSLKRSAYAECLHCQGTGNVKTSESVTIEAMRLLRLACHRDSVRRVEVRVTDAVAHDLHNRKRKAIAELEESGSVQIVVLGSATAPPEHLELTCFDGHDHEVPFAPERAAPPPRTHRRR